MRFECANDVGHRLGHIHPCGAARLRAVAAGRRSFASRPNTPSHRTEHSLRDNAVTHPFCVVDGFSTDFLGCGFEDADDGVLTTHTPLLVWRGGMLILRLATDVGLVDLDGSEHESVLAIGERGPDATSQVPGGLLTDAEIPRQLSAGNPIQAREHEIQRGDTDPTTQR